MRNAAFSYTKRQMENGSKDVTRRIKSTWKVGERRVVIEKGMGLKKGETVKPLKDDATGKTIVIECVSVTREPLWKLLRDPDYGMQEVRREGFPDMTPLDFVEFFCRKAKCNRRQMVYRIEFKRV